MANKQYPLEAVDFRYILLDDYKKLGLKEDELAVLLMIDHLIRQNNEFITADLLSIKMSIHTKDIDKIMVKLIKDGCLEIDTSNGGAKTSLEPLKKKLYKQFEDDLAKDRANLLSAERSEILNRLYAYYEKRLSRTLSPIESDTISNWLDDGYGESNIKDALEDALANGKKTIKSIDKVLRSNRARSDIAKEGYTGINDNWDKDIEETIRIAKTKWLTDDEKK